MKGCRSLPSCVGLPGDSIVCTCLVIKCYRDQLQLNILCFSVWACLSSLISRNFYSFLFCFVQLEPCVFLPSWAELLEWRYYIMDTEMCSTLMKIVQFFFTIKLSPASTTPTVNCIFLKSFWYSFEMHFITHLVTLLLTNNYSLTSEYKEFGTSHGCTWKLLKQCLP